MLNLNWNYQTLEYSRLQEEQSGGPGFDPGVGMQDVLWSAGQRRKFSSCTCVPLYSN